MNKTAEFKKIVSQYCAVKPEDMTGDMKFREDLGFSSLDFIGMTKNDIKDNFIEFYKVQDKCKYQDCLHLKEDGCHVKELVDEGKIRNTRYENYKKFIDLINERK